MASTSISVIEKASAISFAALKSYLFDMGSFGKKSMISYLINEDELSKTRQLLYTPTIKAKLHQRFRMILFLFGNRE